MSENVEIEVGIQVDGAKTLKDLKQELKEAQGQAIALSRQFGELSPQAQEAVQRVAELRDEIADMNERVALADPGAKFQALSNVVQTVAGGFAAAQGAMSLFGTESEDLQKQMVKLQAALALTQGLSTIADSWKDFQRLGAIIKTNVVSAFSTLKGAIIATGIGALVIALGLVISNFEAIENWLKKVIPGFEGFGDIINKVKAVAMGAISLMISEFKSLGEIISNLLTGDFSGALQAWENSGKKAANAYYDGFNNEIKEQAYEAELTALAALTKSQENQLKILRAYGATRQKEANALELTIAQNRVRLSKDSTKEEREAQAAAFADLEALRIKQFQEEGQHILDNLRHRQDLQLQALTNTGANTIGLRQKQLQAQLSIEKKYGLDTTATLREISQQQQNDIKSRFDKELQDLQQQQSLELQAATISGKDIFLLKSIQLEAQKSLYEKYGYDIAEIEQQQAAEALERRQKLNDALDKKIYDHNNKNLTALQNTSQAQTILNQKSTDVATATRLRIEEEEGRKQAAYAATNELIEGLTTANIAASDLEIAAAAAAAIAVNFAEMSKQDSLVATQSAMRIAAKVLSEQSALGKGVAIANTTIDTVKSASGAFSGMVSTIPGPVGIALGIAAAAAAVVAGVARVRQITSVKIPGSSSSSSNSSISNTAVPSIPSANLATNTLIDQAIAQNSNLQQAQRVYVVESDITDAQRRVSDIQAKAQF